MLIVSNETIAPIYMQKLSDALQDASGNEPDQLVLPDGEQYKSLAVLEAVFDTLLEKRHNRTTTLVALGGGVVGDMTGFAAASYQRGDRFVQVPTTLLAQVDSSVGGKTGVNHPQGKNMIGAFHQPTSVIIDTRTLDTLPDRELRAGVAEVIKYGLICDAEFFDWLEKNIDRLMSREQAALEYAIARSCENKARVVAADERESCIRAILNLGHTFGHAIETATEYKTWLHGEAVGCGMVMAVDLSCRSGLVSQQDFERARQLIDAAGLPLVPPPGLPDVDGMVALMGLDKKAVNGKLRLILLKAIGDAFVSNAGSDFKVELLRETLADYLQQASD